MTMFLRRPAPIEQALLQAFAPSPPNYLWLPTSPSDFLNFRRGGLRWSPQNGAYVTYGGILNARNTTNGSPYLTVPSNFGVSTKTTPFVAALLITVNGPGLDTFFKIGNETSGFGFGIANSTASSSGLRVVILNEGVEWSFSTTDITTGPHLVVLGITTENALSCYFARNSATALIGVDRTLSNLSNPASSAQIGARYAGSSFNGAGPGVQVHALALWNISLTNSNYAGFRANLAAKIGPHLDSLSPLRNSFSPRLLIIPFATEAAAATYTLTQATYVPGSLTSSSVTPRIVRTKA